MVPFTSPLLVLLLSLLLLRGVIVIIFFTQKLQLETNVPLDYCRLVVYNSQDDTIERSLEGRENEEIGFIFKKHASWSYKKQEMLMEIRSKDKPFPVYKPGCKEPFLSYFFEYT